MFPTYTSVSHIIERKGTRPQKPSCSFWLNQARLTDNYGPRNPLPTKVAFHKPQENPTSQLSTAILCRNIYQLKIQVEVALFAETWGDCKTEAEVFVGPRASFQVIFVGFCVPFYSQRKSPVAAKAAAKAAM